MMETDLILISVASILLLGNLIIRVLGSKKMQFAFNVAMLLILAARILLETQTAPHVIAGVASINPFSIFFMLLFTIGMAIVNLLAFSYSEDYGDFALLSDFALLGMYLIALSNSLLTIFIGLELASLPAVFIILLSKKGIEAATKFFIMASIAIALLSFALALFYGGTGGLVLSQTSKTELLGFSAMLFIVSLGIDSSIFPFNLLIPDVYQGSPAYVTSMLGGLNKKVAFAALIQILILCFLAYRSAFDVIAILSVATMFYGNIVAIMQDNLKRMLAYSSISQAGYVLIGIATATSAGISASLFLIFSHTFAFIGVMGVVAWLESKNKSNMGDLVGLNSENRLAAFAMTLFMVSFVGIPLTTGFIGKFLVFLSAVNSGLLWLVIIGIINSVISIYYYARPIMAAYTPKHGARRMKIEKPVLAAVLITMAIVVILGIYPQPVISLASRAAAYLLGI